MSIDISKKDKAAVLKALYDFSKPIGLGILSFQSDKMDIKTARRLVSSSTKYDYIGGRVIKVDISGNSFDPWLYDRDNGDGRAKEAIDTVPDTL